MRDPNRNCDSDRPPPPLTARNRVGFGSVGQTLWIKAEKSKSSHSYRGFRVTPKCPIYRASRFGNEASARGRLRWVTPSIVSNGIRPTILWVEPGETDTRTAPKPPYPRASICFAKPGPQMQTPRLGGQGVQVVLKVCCKNFLALPLLDDNREIGVSRRDRAWPPVRFEPEILNDVVSGSAIAYP